MSYHELNLEERIAIRVGLVQKLSLRELNQALSDAVKKSEPFPAFPLGLTADSITLMLEYDFKL